MNLFEEENDRGNIYQWKGDGKLVEIARCFHVNLFRKKNQKFVVKQF